MIRRIMQLVAVLAVMGVGVVACEDMTTTAPEENQPETPGTPGGDGPATLKVLLTDGPSKYVKRAWVDIGRVDLLPAGEEGEPITLAEDATDGPVDLMELQDSATAQLANQEIEPGQYKQLRLIVESASVELAEGYTFRDGSTSKELKVPSGAQTGIKLNLWPADGMEEMPDEEAGIEIIPGQTVLLIVDFDVNRSFVIQGNAETPAGIKSMLFKPTLRVSVQDVAGSISGTVTDASETLESLADLTVTAEPLTESTVPGYQTMTATALTREDGTYTILYLVPGEYEVSVEAPEGYFSMPAADTADVGYDEDVTGIDFVLDETGSISGTVSPEDDSINVEGLTVMAEMGDESHTATTAGDGTYTIDDLRPGDYTVWVEPEEGFVASPETQDVSVEAGEDVTGIDFTILDAAGSIAGTVTFPEAVSAGDLTVMADDGEGTTYEATPGEEGAYSMPYVMPGDYTVTVSVPEGYFSDPASVDVTVEPAEDVTDVDFTVDETGSISGTLIPADDSITVEGLVVTADGANGTFTAEAGADSTYTVMNVVPGDYTVTVAVEEGFATDPESAEVTVGIGEAVADIDFDIDEAAEENGGA